MNCVSSDKERILIENIKKGDADSFMVLIEPFKEKLFNFIASKLKDASTAEDILQNAFLKAFENIGKFEFKSLFYTWLFSITLNELRHYWRKQKKNKEDSIETEIGENFKIADVLRDNKTNIQEQIEMRELENHIFDSVLRLPDIYREIVLLRYYDKLSYEEIAVELEVNIGTVKSRLANSRDKLKEIIDINYL
ncbi:MAG TPA: RNA polymerase sigma factor [bacterium]|nr:RNA polymerase sigma factor [bacterium]HPN29771.1 RNA polymerase sigma factor [bacterium]